MHALCFLRQTQKVGGDAVAGQFTLKVTRPPYDFDAESRAFAQSRDQPLRAFARTEDVNAFPKEWLFHHPEISAAPAQQGESENNKAGQRRTISRHNVREKKTNRRERKRHKSKHQQQSKNLVPLRPLTRGIVKVKPVGEQQYNTGDYQDLYVSILYVQQKPCIFTVLHHGSQHEREPNDHGFAHQKNQRAHRIVDFEESDHVPYSPRTWTRSHCFHKRCSSNANRGEIQYRCRSERLQATLGREILRGPGAPYRRESRWSARPSILRRRLLPARWHRRRAQPAANR